MSDPRISRAVAGYRPLTPTSQGWQGFPASGWSLWPESGPRPVGLPGSFKPGSTNTGVTSSRARTVFAGVADLSVTGQVFRDVDFYTYVRVLAPGQKFYNCGFYGGTSWPKSPRPLVDCSSGVDSLTSTVRPWEGIPYFEDCTFKAQRPSYFTDAIRGSFWLNRCNVYRVHNGAVVSTASDTRIAHTRIESSYLHDLVYWYKMPDDADSAIFAVDVRAPGYIYIGGNTIEGSCVLGNDRNYNDPDGAGYPGGSGSGRYPLFVDHLPHAPGGGLRAQSTRGLDEQVTIEKNWFDKGLTGAELGPGTYNFRENIFTKDGFYLRRADGSRRRIRVDSMAELGGLPSNRYTTGELMTTSNGGILF